MNEPTALELEQKADIEKRKLEFFKRHEANVAELQVNFGIRPSYVQISPSSYGTTIVTEVTDTKYLPKTE